jgi:dihydrofolate reductase
MRKLKLEIQISIDGYIADVNGKTDWMIWNWGDELTWDADLTDYVNRLHSSIDCVLLSRNMAQEGFISYWDNASESSNHPIIKTAKQIATAQKIVFTKTLTKNIWDNTVLANGNFIEEIDNLKKQNGKDIIVYGGATFVSSLIKEGLIDEFYLFINPTILGKGLPIFTELNNRLNLILIESIGYNCGIVVLKYVSKNN